MRPGYVIWGNGGATNYTYSIRKGTAWEEGGWIVYTNYWEAWAVKLKCDGHHYSTEWVEKLRFNPPRKHLRNE